MSAATADQKITCAICGAKVHAIELHLKREHPEVSLAQYGEQFPEEPLMSDYAIELMEKKREERAAAEAREASPVEESSAPLAYGESSAASVSSIIPKDVISKGEFHKVFGLGSNKEALSAKGGAIPISIIAATSFPDLVPETSDEYVYNIDELKNVILALELNIPCYVWGHKGAGKSELYEQIAARTGRPYCRLQHTVNTEESHIVGQWIVKDGATVFELGQLPLAMKYGWMYVADEYDFALPSVLSVYQAVLEGKPLVIKEADAANRIIKPHPNFRFCATGNTNGSGDDTGLYQGTSLQNSANYDRFGMVIHKQYLGKADESAILCKRVGLVADDANKMADFACLVREAYAAGKISDTISPRTLINAAKIGIKRASFRQGIQLSFINKLSKVDREVVDGLAARIFG